ncbi:alpha-protein kinase 1-like [Maniola hyperantus]|uniref:alpha-protein kinase 1-like n=1 Tax=Aphantopus hyperantus TaxID=2795564 RepID=UPI001567FC7B|nr:alpha-protein kinase 1-like [Maniola hyperantus]
MRLIFWVTAVAVLSTTYAKNSTTKTKPKRQLDDIRTPQNLQYSLILPHSRVAHFRSISSNRRISNVVPRGGKLPPYAVQMEPVVQYSQKDPLYDPTHDNLVDAVNHNDIYAQPKILNVHDQGPESSFGPPYGALPTAPLYREDSHPHYIEAPEPIIEIIIKESNETLPAPPPPQVYKKKKEPVHVFYVKYSKDPHSKDKVVYEKPIPAITPPSNEDDHHEEYVTVTPQPYYIPSQTTTLRAIIKPESEVYHSNSNVKITFGNDEHHYGYRREENHHGEEREETAPRPAIALPNPQPTEIQTGRSASPKTQYNEHENKHFSQSSQQAYQSGQKAQSRIQFQQQPQINHEPQLPRQGPSVTPFRAQAPRQPFGPAISLRPFSNVSPSPSQHFSNVAPTIPGPIGPSFSSFPRPNNPPTFNLRQNNPPSFGSRPHYNGPPRVSFHPGPQRPQQQFFDEAKYLQENYHTITTDQVDLQKQQLSPNRPIQNLNLTPKPNPSPSSVHFTEHQSRPQQIIPFNQQLPQQRPPQVFDSNKNKQSFTINPNRPPFFNLKPSPPHIEDNRPPFQRQPLPHPPQQHVSFQQGPQTQLRPSPQISSQDSHNQNIFLASPSSTPSPIPHNQFLPQPSSTPFFSFQSSPSSNQPQNFHQQSLSERPQGLSNLEHQQNVQQFVPNGGELVASIPRYEHHITVNGPDDQHSFSGGLNIISQPTPTASQVEQQAQSQYIDAEQEQVRQQLAQNVRKQQEEIQRLQNQLQFAHQHQQQQQQQQQHQHQQQQQQQQQQQRQQHQQQQQQQQEQQEQQQQHQQQQHQLQQQQQHQQQQQQQQQQHQQAEYEQRVNQYNQQQQAAANNQYVQERSRLQPTYVTSSASPEYYQSTSRTVEIKPTTQKYGSSTVNAVSNSQESQKEQKKRPAIELPDEVPDDLRQQLLSSGILDNADISVLDYDKVGETPLESLPPDQLANFFSAGGAQQIAASEHRPVVVKPNGDRIESRIDDNFDEDDQDIAASENLPSIVAPPNKQAVEMKVVLFDPKTAEGQKIANDYVQEDATQVDPVALNDKKYNRYLPLKVSGNQFPLPDVLKGRKITSVVVLAPVETEALDGEHLRTERSATDNLRGIKFVAGESLHKLLRRPTKDNFEKWLDMEKRTATDEQSVILLVTGNEEKPEDREIFMYDIATGNVSKLSGDLSNAFVEAAENNSLSKDFEKLAIEGEGTPENFNKEKEDAIAEGSDNVPLFVDLSGVKLDKESNKGVLISSGYSKTKRGRSFRRH